MNKISFYTITDTPIGKITLTSNGSQLTGLYINDLLIGDKIKKAVHRPEIFAETEQQLSEYFAGKRQNFTIPISQKGTPFQIKVWEKLQDIGYGKTISYKELASLSGVSKAFRAVGSANSKNCINIIVPCHRVISVNGKISGYNCGTEIKKWLLEHEQAFYSLASETNNLQNQPYLLKSL